MSAPIPKRIFRFPIHRAARPLLDPPALGLLDEDEEEEEEEEQVVAAAAANEEMGTGRIKGGRRCWGSGRAYESAAEPIAVAPSGGIGGQSQAEEQPQRSMRGNGSKRLRITQSQPFRAPCAIY